MALQKLYTSINIITTLAEGKPLGMTAAWVMQVSFEPEMVVVAIGKDNSTLRGILKSGRFGINTCGKDCLNIAIKFGTTSGPDKFKEIRWRESHSVPLIDGAIAFAVARLVNSTTAGDHTLLIGEIIHSQLICDEIPLLYGEDAILKVKDLTKIEF